jgi:hypothetical protein
VRDDFRLNPSTTTASTTTASTTTAFATPAFATAPLVGLGLILNYLSAYFIGPYFQLVSNGVCFILLLVITLTGFALLIKLASKVISLLVLMGGSAVPLIVVSGSYTPLLSLLYSLLIGCCALLR